MNCKESFWNASDYYIYSLDIIVSRDQLEISHTLAQDYSGLSYENIDFNKKETTGTKINTYSIPSKQNITIADINDIQSALDVFFLPSRLDNYHCKFCKKTNSCVQQFYIKDPPKYLVINVKRYNLYTTPLTMIKKAIINSSTVTLDQYILNVVSDNPIKNYKYNLRGIINHYGNLKNGHYTAYIKSKKWYYVNDSNVHNTKYSHFERCQSFLLFYEYCDSDKKEEKYDEK